MTHNHDWHRPCPFSDELVCRSCNHSSLDEDMVTETTLWQIRLMRVGVLIAKIPLLAGDVLEDYLHLKGIIAIGDESMWKLKWQQAKMKEAEYEWIPNVDARSAPDDVIPEPT